MTGASKTRRDWSLTAQARRVLSPSGFALRVLPGQYGSIQKLTEKAPYRGQRRVDTMRTDPLTLVAQFDGGTCGLCGCHILAGDVLLYHPEVGVREHRCCREVASEPRTPYFGYLFEPERPDAT